ncbi:hypothetical protein MNBD_ALPHA02-2199 [hydrothermal vent metagenome]|uniref:Ice-binding protein C-terminal domain-containing protein n=1 Tax=hydrothermal vent metagenome TaxID=652676 RepID=A0A3B0S3G7_9ZZZZ
MFFQIFKINHKIITMTAILGSLLINNSAWAVPVERDLYVTDSEYGNIFVVDPSKSVSILVSEAQIMAATGATEARFTDNGLYYDQATDNLYFTDSESDSVLVRNSSGVVSVVSTAAQITAATGGDSNPEHITMVNGDLFVTDARADSLLKIDIGTGNVAVWTPEADFVGVTGITSVDMHSGIAVSADGTTIYVASDDAPNAVFAVDVATGDPTLLATDSRFNDLDVFLTLAPNGDIIIADDSGGDDIFRVTPTGTVSIFLSETELEDLTGFDVNLEGGLVFDEFGNFYLAEERTDNIYKWLVDDILSGTIDVASGALYLSQADVVSGLGLVSTPSRSGVDYEGGIVFGRASVMRDVPEPAPLALLGLGLLGLGLARGRRR